MAHKRGQAALEFLSTYGFAFLIILVMIGALTYFGILSPGKFIPGSCLISPEFKCKDRQITFQSQVATQATISIVNQLGNQVTLINPTNWNATATGFSTSGVCGTPLNSLVGGANTTIICNLTGNFPAKGEKMRVSIDFQYQTLGGDFPHPVRAEIVETIQ